MRQSSTINVLCIQTSCISQYTLYVVIISFIVRVMGVLLCTILYSHAVCGGYWVVVGVAWEWLKYVVAL